MRNYIFSLDIDPIERGRAYEKLPLHCTIMPRFQTSMDPDGVIRKTAEAFRFSAPITLVSGAPALFGTNNDVPAHTLVDTKQLIWLHKQILWTFRVSDVTQPESGQWVGAYFTPHVSDYGDKKFAPGTEHIVKTVTLFERIENGDMRELHAVVQIQL